MTQNIDSVELWKAMASGNCFSQLVQATLPSVLVVGPMGAGKSTNISIQLGAKYEEISTFSEEEGMNVRKLYCVQSDKSIPATAGGSTSKTLNIGMYEPDAKLGGYVYLDTAGIDEDRGPHHRLWTQWSLATAFQVLPKIKCVMLVLDYRALFASRGKSVRDVARALSNVVGTGASSNHFYDSMIFLISHGFEKGDVVTHARVQVLAKRQYEEMVSQHKAQIKACGKDVPPSDAEVADMDDKVAIMALLKTLMDATGKIHMCSPTTPEQSVLQQETVQKMIDRSEKPITKEGLMEIVQARPGHNLKVMQTLAKLVAEPFDNLGDKSYVQILRQIADNRKQLVEQLKAEKDMLTACCSNWQVVQRDEADKLGRQRDELNEEKRTASKNIKTLQKSTKAVKVDAYEVKKECPGSLWWVLAGVGGGWLWGKSSATYTMGYKGGRFAEYKLQGENFTSNVLEENRLEGELTIKFKSKAGKNLCVTVDFFLPEKDTQAAEDQVVNLQRQVEDLSKQIEQLEQRATSVRAADSGKALTDLFMKDKGTMEQADKDFQDLLDKDAILPTPEVPKPPTELAVLTNILRLLSVLKTFRLEPEGLAASTRDTIDNFVSEYNRMQTLMQELKACPGFKFVDVKDLKEVSVAREDVPSVQPSIQARIEHWKEQISAEGAVQASLHTIDHIQRNASAFAIAALMFGLVIKIWPAQTFQDFVGYLVMFIAIYMIAAKVLSTGVQNASMAADAVNRKVDVIGDRAANFVDGVQEGVRNDIDRNIDTVKDMLKASWKSVKDMFSWPF